MPFLIPLHFNTFTLLIPFMEEKRQYLTNDMLKISQYLFAYLDKIVKQKSKSTRFKYSFHILCTANILAHL